MGIDTCARATTQWAARGYVDPSHLVALSDELKRLQNDESDVQLRILVAHHTFESNRWEGFETTSRQILEQFITQNDVKLVLSGHAHEARQIAHPGGFYELRCGTTLQLQDPQRVRNALACNEFLTHTFSVQDDDGGVRIEVNTTPYRRFFSHFRHNGKWPTLAFK